VIASRASPSVPASSTVSRSPRETVPASAREHCRPTSTRHGASRSAAAGAVLERADPAVEWSPPYGGACRRAGAPGQPARSGEGLRPPATPTSPTRWTRPRAGVECSRALVSWSAARPGPAPAETRGYRIALPAASVPPARVPASGTAESDYLAIIDERCKVRTRTPTSAKFRDWPLALDDDDADRTRAGAGLRTVAGGNVAAFFQAPSRLSQRRQRRERATSLQPLRRDAGADPADWPGAHVLPVRAQPLVGICRHPAPCPPAVARTYLLGWTINQ